MALTLRFQVRLPGYELAVLLGGSVQPCPDLIQPGAARLDPRLIFRLAGQLRLRARDFPLQPRARRLRIPGLPLRRLDQLLVN